MSRPICDHCGYKIHDVPYRIGTSTGEKQYHRECYEKLAAREVREPVRKRERFESYD